MFWDLVHDLIGPDVCLYWDQAVYKKPGTGDLVGPPGLEPGTDGLKEGEDPEEEP